MNTFRWHLELSALGNLDSLARLVPGALGHVFDLLHNIVSFEDLSKDDVAAIEPACDDGGDEELAAVRVLSAVGHAKQTLACMLQLEVFIRELLAVNRLAAGAISAGKVALEDVSTLSPIKVCQDANLPP